MAFLRGLLIILICAAVLTFGRLVYLGLDSLAGAFGATNRNDVAVADIQADRDVQIAEIQADRDVQIAETLTKGQLGTACIESGANAHRCMTGTGIEGVNPGASLTWMQTIFLWIVSILALFAVLTLIVAFFGGDSSPGSGSGKTANVNVTIH